MSEGPATGQRRPDKPPMGWRVPAGVVVFVALTVWSANGIGFSVVEVVRNLGNAGDIVRQLLDPSWGFVDRTIPPFLETLRMAILGSLLGSVTALLVAFGASRVSTLSGPVHAVSRTFLNLVRSVPDVLYALVFVAALGIGPLPGVLALMFFNIGVVAKLTSETVDAVDTGPIEAAEAAGSTRVQTVRTAIYPQVLPNYLAFALYAFELNLRASTILGFVGAGGLGLLFQVVLSRFRYDLLAVMIVEVFVIVFVVESISIAIRRRLV